MIKYPNVDWSLPLLFCNDEYILSVAYAMKKLGLRNPITNAYGMVPSLWTGGRGSSKLTQNKEYIEKVLNLVLNTGTIPTFTISKYDIEDSDLNDEFCNWILDFGVANKCRFIITSDKLFDYIKKRYPEAVCVASVFKPIYELDTQELSETDYYNMLLDKYDCVVVKPEYCLSTLLDEYEKITDISRIEVLVNQTCAPYCKVAKRHGLLIPKCDWMLFKYGYYMDVPIKCPNDKIYAEGKSNYLTQNTLMMSEKEIDNLVNNIGIRNLKLQGRGYDFVFNTRLMNNYLFEEIGDFQNICPLIWGTCEQLKQRGVIPI